MVVQRTINNLKERPKHERKAVASSLAIGLIIILLVGWAIVFFTRIRSDVQDSTIQNTPTTATSTTPINPVTTNTYQTDAQIQQQAQNQSQTPSSTTVQLNSTTY